MNKAPTEQLQSLNRTASSDHLSWSLKAWLSSAPPLSELTAPPTTDPAAARDLPAHVLLPTAFDILLKKLESSCCVTPVDMALDWLSCR